MSRTNEGANSRQVAGDHYSRHGDLQHWDVVAHFNLDYFQGQITKYVMRWRDKGGVQDLEKARHFLDKYIEVELARAAGSGAASKVECEPIQLPFPTHFRKDDKELLPVCNLVNADYGFVTSPNPRDVTCLECLDWLKTYELKYTKPPPEPPPIVSVVHGHREGGTIQDAPAKTFEPGQTVGTYLTNARIEGRVIEVNNGIARLRIDRADFLIGPCANFLPGSLIRQDVAKLFIPGQWNDPDVQPADRSGS